ncbi:MAG: hypothetical protein U5N58_10330 [Actinomycetota bacterium]|nr:hypothetical protein [Actinomycetota bacterium]
MIAGYEPRVYQREIYDAEVSVAGKLKKIQESPLAQQNIDSRSIDKIIDELAERNNIFLDTDQKQAIAKANTEKMLVITGKSGHRKEHYNEFCAYDP